MNKTKSCCLFEDQLEFFSPMPHRIKGTERDGLPESFDLHVAPSACGRRMAIGSYQRNSRNRRAHLYISESDIVSGCYEDLVPEAVEKILATVKPAPRAISVIVTCIDDLLGTDHEALLMLLQERFPETHFCIRRVDPIRRHTAPPPPVNMQVSMFSMLDPSTVREDAINLIGNMPPIVKDSELFSLAGEMGLQVRQIDDCATFDDFLAMSRSRLNLVTTPIGLAAAQEMEQRLGLPYLYAPGTYRIEDISAAYQAIAERTGKALPDLSSYQETARREIAAARARLGDTPIVVDSSGDFRPLSLARTLLEYGFCVRLVTENLIFDGDLTDYHWLRENHPEVEILPPNSAELDRRSEELAGCLCIGFSSAYLLNAKHLVDFSDNENAADLRVFLETAGWRVGCSFMMGASLEDIRDAANAEVNLVVSQSGMGLARRMWRQWRIPYVVGTPAGTDHTALAERIKRACETGVCSPMGEASLEPGGVLIVGEQVLANTIRERLAAQYGLHGVTVGTFFGLDRDLAQPFDLDLPSEAALVELIQSGRYQVLVGDPLLQEIPGSERLVCFSIPHVAVSSKLYWHDYLRFASAEMEGLLARIAQAGHKCAGETGCAV